MAKRFVVRASKHEPPTFYVWDRQEARRVTGPSLSEQDTNKEATRLNSLVK